MVTESKEKFKIPSVNQNYHVIRRKISSLDTHVLPEAARGSYKIGTLSKRAYGSFGQYFGHAQKRRGRV